MKLRLLISLVFAVTSLWNVQAQTVDIEQGGSPINSATACTGITLNLTANASGAGIPGYVWSYQGSPLAGQTTANLSFTFGSAGSGNLVVEYTDNGSTVASDTISLTVLANPSASWNPTDTIFCENETGISFSAGSGTFFGNGVSGNGNFDPSAAGAGVHTIGYYETNGVCADTVMRSIEVLASPNLSVAGTGAITIDGNPYFRVCTSSSSQGFQFFNSSSTGGLSNHYVDFGDGSTTTFASWPAPLTHTYTSPGLYFFRYAAQAPNGCWDTVTYRVFFGTNPSGGITTYGNTQGCEGSTFAFQLSNVSNNPDGTEYVVSFSDGSPAVTYSHPPPDTIFHTFNEGSCGFTTGGGTPFNNAYEASVVITNPCGTTSGDVRPIYVAEAPISGFEWLDPICLGTPTTFTDTSYAGTDPANGFCPGGSNRVWEITALTGGSFTIGSGFAGLRFGSDPQLWINGSSTIDVTFNQEGTYAINIYVWNTASCGVDSTTHIICVTNPPVTDIYIEDSVYLCSPDTTLIAYNGDIYGACDTTQLTWSITPNTGWSIVSSNDTSMQVRFNTAGEYYVSVTATNECGSDSETDTIFVFGEPTVFLPTDLTNCGPITIDFGAPPYVPVENDSLSPISARSWTITPGSGWTLQSGSLTGADPEILFSDPGVYQVVYSITNDCGTAYDTMLVEVYDVPVLDALNDTLICHLSDITVIASVTGGTPAYTWNWTLDGNPVGGNSDTLSLTNLTSGGIVQVIVTDQNGCADTVAFNLSVNPALSVSVTPDQTICYNDTLALSASGVGGSGPYTYVWTPGGQLSDSTIANPDFYADGSPVTLYVTVTDSEGCTATDSVQISIFPLTLVNAGPDTTFCFQNIVETLPTPNPTGGTWSGTGVVDGTVGTFNPFVAGLGTHQVVYRYEDANGCVFRDTIEVDVINPTPVSTMADFAVCLGDADVTLTATPSGGSWSVLSGSATVLTDSTFSPSIAGTYTILYTRGAGSCQTFDTLTIFVAENPILQNPGTFTICSGQTFSFTPSFQVPSSFEFRSFVLNGNVTGNTATGNGPIADVLINLSTSPDTVIYRFAGTRTDSAGCVGDSADVTVIVEPRPILQNTNLTDTICHGDVFTFVPNFNISGVTPLWTGSGAMQNQVRSSGSGNIVDTLFNPSGSIVSVTYQVYSFGLNSLSCGSDTTIITVWIQPEVVANAGGDLNLCSDEVGNLGEANQAGFSYDWTPGIHLSDSTISNPTFQYTNSGATNEVFTYVVLKTDLTTGCFDHDTVVVKVYPDPTFNAGSNIAFCNGDTVQLGANPGVGITYSWTSNPAGFTSSDAQPFVSPTVPTDYYVSYSVDSTGCTFQDTITVTPIANPVAIVAAVPDSGCSPLSLVLQDNSPGATARYWVVNGDTLADQNVTVNQTWINNSFTQDSIVEVILFIEAGTGCNASDTVQVYIHPKPFADFSMPSDVCANGTISTTNSSLVQGPETYLWTANSPGVVIINPTDAQPSITFPDNQSGSDSIYDITLTVTSVNGCVDDTTISITVFSRPVADFSLPARACGPATVNPTDLSTTNHPGLSYIWTVTPSAGVVTSGLNTATPSFDFPVSTADSVVYSILLGITDDNGCIDTLRQSYTVYPKPTANFNVALRDSCGPYTVQFNNISLPNQNPEDIDDMTFVWDFGNGQTSTAQQPSVTFTNTGVHDSTYYVTLIATNAYGCSDTIVDSITVYPNPLAELDVTGFVECAPYVIDSTVISAIQYPFANDTYTWTIYDTDFNSLGTFNGPNAVSYQLLTDGDSIYIGLSVENVHGCQEDTTLQLFYTIEDPTAAFAAIPDTGCTPLTVQIQDSSSSGVTYTWFVNGVQQGTTAANPSFTFQNQSLTQDSLITIQLVITAGTGCTDTTSRTVLVRPGPFAEFSIPSSVCANGSVATTNTSIAQGPETYFWTASSSSVVITNPTDAQPIFAFPDNQTGTDSIYDITLTVTSANGCTDDTTVSITVFSRPVADFSLPADGCGPTTINPTDLSTTNHPALSYVWTVSPTTGVTTAGMNTATPTIDFPVSLSDSVVYDILLAITDDNGCIDTLRQNYTVYPKPTAAYTVALRDSCGPFTVQFNNTSVPNQVGEDINDMTFAWDFGNGQTSTDQQPSAIITNSGVHDSTYFVTLIATNVYGCSDTIVDSITVYPNPLAQLDVTGFVACAPYVIDSSVVRAITYPFANDTYDWTIYDTDFNTITTFSGPSSVLYTLATDGDSVFVGLSVSNAHGCQVDTALQLFYTIENPIAAFAAVPDTGCTPLTVQIQDSSSVGVTYTWFVNGVQQATTAANPSFTFQNQSLTQDSLITIQLVITAGTGCTDTTSRTVLVRPGPLADFSIPSDVCASGSVLTTNNSVAQGPETYLWTASSTAVVIASPTDAQPIISFPDNQSGTDSIYDITLTVTSANGCTDDTTISITVYSRPVADFIVPPFACGPTTINPVDQSTTNNPLLSYTWTVTPNTGVVTSGLNTATPSISFPVSTSDSLVYEIFLTVVDDNGCSDTLRQNYTVYPKPTADFNVALRDSCGPFTVQFNNTSVPNQVGEDINDMTFVWDFGNGQSSTDQQPSAIFTNTGVHDSTYIVTLIATNAYGCSDTIVDSITVYPNPLAQLNVTGTVECAPYFIDSTVVSAVEYPFANDDYNWTVYDADLNVITTFNGPSSVNYTLPTDGDTVFIGLSVTNVHGCQEDTVLQRFYTIEDPIAAFAAIPDTGCSPPTVQIQDSSSVGVTYTWFINGMVQSTTIANPSFTFVNQSTTQDSTITIQLVITAGTGCTDTVAHDVTIYPQPFAEFSMPATTCANTSVATTNTSVFKAPESYLWTASSPLVVIANPTSAQPIIAFPDNQTGVDSIYDITLTVTSANGCTDDTTVSIIVFSRPVADFSLPANGCGPTTINPTDLSTTNHPALSYTWTVSPTTGVTTAGMNSAAPTIDFPVSQSDSVVYDIFLTITDDNGCIDTLRQDYTVYPKPTAAYTVALRDSCGPFTVQFNNTSVPNQAGEDINDMTFAWDFGNGQTSTDQQPSAVFTNTGVHDSTYVVTLIATNAYGCSDTIVDSITVYPNPLAQLNVTGTVECAPYLIDSTVVNAVQYPFANDDYNWTVYDSDFNVITTFNGPNSVNYTLLTDGDTIYIGLSATNVHGCQEDTVLQRFYTIENPVAAFAAVPDTGCSPLTVQIQDSSSVGVTYEWFINGVLQSTTQANPSFTFVNQSLTQDSTITIQLVITAGSGCTDTVAHNVTIYPQPFAEFSMPATTCANTAVSTTNTSAFKAPESYLWTASSPLVVITNPTDAQPIIAFPDNQTGVDSTYDITLTVTSANGCTDDTTVSITVFSRPVADFSLPANGCGPTTINPTDLSTTNHPALSYVWTVSPTTGVTTSGMNTASPTIDFPVSQNDSVVYDIFLTITDDNGCIDTLRQNYTVYPKPTATYTVALRDSCGPFTVQFNNTSVPNQAGEDINDMTFVWDFGNGQTSTDQQPSAVFTNTGVHDSTYIVTLIATNAYGCSDTIVDSITVYPNPLAQQNVTGTVECAPYLIDSTVVSAVQYPFANDDYTWTVYDTDFNTIATFNGPNAVNHTIQNDADSVYIGLSVTNVHGCQEDTLLQLFYTIEDPVAAFAAVPDTGCSPLTVQIQDSSSVGVTYEWFLNGVLQSTTSANPSFTFVNQSTTQDSTITIQLVITAGTGCTDTVAHDVTIYPQPFAEFSMPSTTCANTSVATTNTSAFKAPESYLWTASSPLVVITNPTDAQPIIAFPDNQTGVDSIYDITLTVTSANGCTDDTTVSITVFSRPVADFSLPANGCGPTTINPTDLSTTNHPTLSYAWTVSPTIGVTTAGMNTASPTIDFPVSQNDSVVYDIFLTITDDNGCIDTLRQNYTVYPKPTAAYTVALRDSCGPFTVQFNNTSVPNQAGEDINDMTFAWDFGNGQTDTAQQPTAVFTNTGVHDSTYFVTLISTNAYGCSDTIVDSITVYPNPLAQLNLNGSVECAPYLIDSTVVSAVQYPFANDDYNWTVYDTDFNTIATFNGPNAVNHTIQNDADSVYIGLSVTNVHGCQEDTLLQLFYTIEDPVAVFTAIPDTGCSPLVVQIQDSSSVGVTYEWFINGVLQSTTAANPSFTFTNNSTTADSIITIQLVVTAGTGCTDTVAHDVTIYPQPFAEFTIAPTVCAAGSLVPTNTSTFKTPEQYLWTVNSTAVVISTPNDTQPIITFPDNQTGIDSIYDITLTVFSVNGCSDDTTISVTAHSRPVADFSLPMNGCGPTTINPVDLSTTNHAPLSYTWTVTPNTGVTTAGMNSAAPTIEFPVTTSDSVVYDIFLAISDANGCADTITQTYTVYPKPTADFTAGLRDSCGPFTVQFTNISVPNQTGEDINDMSFTWDFGNGQTDTAQQTSATFTNTGVVDSTYIVTLIATNAYGCSDTLVDSITVYPNPLAELSITDSVDCAPYTIDSSIVQAVQYPVANDNYTWIVTDLSGTSLYTTTGPAALNYTIIDDGDSVLISLITSNIHGCAEDTITQLFFTIEDPVAVFEAVPDSGCSPLTVQIQDSSTVGVSYEWFVNDVLQSTTASQPSFTFTNTSASGDSTLVIKLVVTAGTGCTDTTERTVVVFPQPFAEFSIAPTVCANGSLVPTNTSSFKPPEQYLWTVNSPAVVITNPNDAQPIFSFPDNQSLVDSIYDITLTIYSANGCSDDTTISVTVHSRPVADFTLPSANCGPTTINPTDISTTNHAPLSYTWTVAPTAGVITTGMNSASPTIDFPVTTADSVVYDIFLTITDANGCIDTNRQGYTVYPKPTADFTVERRDSCGPFTVQFNNISVPNQTGEDINDMTFNWDFGNGQTSTDQQPSATFTNTGTVDSTYTVVLIATNAYGCSDTLMDSITVHPNPLADFTWTSDLECAPFTVDSTFVTTTDYPVANSNYTWTVHHPINLTTLATFNGINALNYTIASPADSVLIRLVVSSPFGCSNDTLEHVFTTIPNPVPGFILSDTAGCHPLTVAITDTSSPGVTYEWFINGQLSSTLAQPNFTLTNTSTSADSTYTTKLIVTAGGTGCRDSTEQFVTVYGLPVASFSATEVCQDDSTYFTDASTGIVPLTSWFWDFGDGNSDTTQNPVHLYDTAGVYTVLLSVTDARGCMQHDTVDVIVRPNPVVDFSVAPDCGVDTVCIGDLITLSDLSTVYPLGAPINQWAWDINADGSVEYTAQNPTHTFNTPGMTAIELTVTTQYSCETILLDSIFVKEPPLAGFTMDTTAVCGPLNVNFTNTSIGLIDTFEWEVYSLDSLGNRVVIYTHTGFDPNPVPTFRPSFIGDTTFYIELTATNCCGVDIFTDSITLKPLPVAAMLPSVTQGCSPLHVTFQLDGLIKGDPDYLTLDFGDGTPTDTLYEYFLINFQGDTVWFWGQPVHTFTYFGQNPDTTYTVTLSAYNECGDSTVTVDITVFPNTVQAFFIASPQQGCSPLTVDFYDRSYQGTNITWCFEWDTITNTCGQFTATGDTVQHTYTGFGTYIAAQIIDDGCSFDTAFVPILVYPAPTADFSVPANTCEDDSVFFQNLSTVDTGSINTVIWDFGDGTTSTQLDPTHVFDTAGVYSVCLTVGTNYGCFDSICYTLTIYDKPQFDVTVENACLNEQPVQFSDSSTVSFGSIVSRTWDFGDGNTSAQPFPQHTYAQAGTYTVVLTLESSNGCLDSLVQQVQIFPLPEASFTTALTSGDSCGVPQTYQFSNTSTAGAGFYWDFDYVNNPGTWTSTQNNPVFTYNQTGVYEVALFVENSFGCFDTAFTTLYIRPVPEAGFEGDTLVGCSPLFVQFTDTSNYDFSGPGGIVDWIWDFGDGTTVSGIQNPAHLYEDDGLFSVTLIVITDGGCSDTLTYTDYVRVYPRPQANFNSARIRGSRFQFNNTSVYEDSSTVFVWDFGDGTRSIQRNPVHQYNVDLLAGDYQFEVCLYALNSYECPDTICQPLFIRGYQLSVPNAFAPDRPAIGEASIFLPKGHSMIYYDCKIYDKWGTLVFESDTDDLLDGIPTKSWNGRFMNEGEILPAGAYVWKINAQFEDGTIWPGQGNTWDDDIENVGTVNLIR